MVPELIEALPEQWARRGVSAWRCVVCGEVIDPVIVANRVSVPALDHASKWDRHKFAVPLSKKTKA